jgi:phosphoribosyl 1,2-cyclic phosphate phosphodiesterase
MQIMCTGLTICADLRCRNASASRSTPIPRRWRVLGRAFGYCLETPAGSEYPPITEPSADHLADEPIRIDGAGGAIEVEPLDQVHGSIRSLGFRIGGLAYCCDVSDFPRAPWRRFQDLDVLIIDSPAIQAASEPSVHRPGAVVDRETRSQTGLS